MRTDQTSNQQIRVTANSRTPQQQTNNTALQTTSANDFAGSASKLGELNNQSSQIKHNLFAKFPNPAATAANFGSEATVTKTGGKVIINTSCKDDRIGITQNPKTGDVTVNVNGKTQTFSGSDRNNLVIKAGGGNDVITVGSGVTVNLTIEGGDGDDRITGGAGNDTIEGGRGNDTINGGAGRDYLNGSLGDDTINGGNGNDVIYGGDGNDLLRGQNGNDYVEGGIGNDRLYGNNGNDIVSGGLGDDSIYGGKGNDNLYAGQGKDRLYNEQGRDTIYAQTAEDNVIAAPKGGRNVVVNVDLRVAPGTQIRVEGSDEFKERVAADLEFLRSSPTGRQMLEAFDQAYNDSRNNRAGWVFPFNVGAKNDGNTVVIKEGGNTANTTGGNDVWGNPLTGQRSGGEDAVINYDVRNTTLYGNNPTNPNDDWNDTPPSVVLYHEMAHNYNYVTGSLAPGQYNGTEPIDNGQNNRERQAVGLPIDHDNNPSTPEQLAVGHPYALTENGLRDELDIPLRPTYAN